MLNYLFKGSFFPGMPKSLFWLLLSWLMISVIEKYACPTCINDGEYETASFVVFILGDLAALFGLYWNNRK